MIMTEVFMYISKRKRRLEPTSPDFDNTVPVCEADGDAFPVPSEKITEERGIAELQASENFPEAEPLVLERELYLEPEDEPRESYMHDEDDMPDIEDGGDNEIAVPDDPQDLDDGEDEGEGLTYEQFMAEKTDNGVLRIQTSAGNGSIPLVNVNVVVYKDLADGRHVFYTVVTNADGVADGLILPAPPRENSVEGNGAPPFASYAVAAEREGMRGETVENVPIFAGVKSIQPITLTNLPSEV